MQDEIEQLAIELADRRAALRQCEIDRDAIQKRLQENQPTAALMPSQIESNLRRGKADQAWRQALDLDRLRQTILNDQATLPRLEQACWSLQFHIRLLERKLERMRNP
jgi:hypothetical protein